MGTRSQLRPSACPERRKVTRSQDMQFASGAGRETVQQPVLETRYLDHGIPAITRHQEPSVFRTGPRPSATPHRPPELLLRYLAGGLRLATRHFPSSTAPGAGLGNLDGSHRPPYVGHHSFYSTSGRL